MRGKLDPEVLAELVAKLRRERRPDQHAPTSSGRVYELTRDELAGAYNGRILMPDRAATLALCEPGADDLLPPRELP